jgi:hypothetical protein
VSCTIEKLVEHMRELLDNQAEARRLGEHAKEVARSRFGLDRFIREWNAAFALVTSSSLASGNAMNSQQAGHSDVMVRKGAMQGSMQRTS